MIPTGYFKVGPYECYVANVNLPKVDVMLRDTFPLLKAERAASTVARLLGSSDIELTRLRTAKVPTYGCKVFSIDIKELEKWQV